MKKLIYFLTAASLTCGVYALTPSESKSHDAAVNRQLNTFNSVVRQLEMNYVDTIRTDEAFEAAIYAFTSTIDPYTEYYNAEDAEKFSAMTTGEYGGIGSYIVERDGWVYISGPYEDSPAEKGGLKAGDKLIRIDTTDLKGKKSAEVSSMLKGIPGTMMNVTVVRPFVEDSIITLTIEREKVHMPSLSYYGRVGDKKDIGYVKFESFMEKTPDEVKEALEALQSEGELNGLILDLRGNGGGLLTAAIDILGYFLPKNTEVLTTKGKDGVLLKTFTTPRSPIMPEMPLAVLIDGSSASASEITAGAIQDLDRGVLIGERSYGKGLVQSTYQLPYNELLKVTTAKYYIPSGRLVQAVDYSKRNVDGSAQRIPDSLTNVFRTRAGREVRDGGGLTPDITVAQKKYSSMLSSLVRDFWIFDFITKYKAEHPAVASPEEFTVTDEIFEEFKNSIDPEKFKYDRPAMEQIKKLKEVIDSEGAMNDTVQSQLEALERLMDSDLAGDLVRQREDISEFLGPLMMERYYHEKGRVKELLKNDPEVAKAVEVLQDSAEYQGILNGKQWSSKKR